MRFATYCIYKREPKGPELEVSAIVSYLQQDQLAPILTSLAVGNEQLVYLYVSHMLRR